MNACTSVALLIIPIFTSGSACSIAIHNYAYIYSNGATIWVWADICIYILEQLCVHHDPIVQDSSNECNALVADLDRKARK